MRTTGRYSRSSRPSKYAGSPVGRAQFRKQNEHRQRRAERRGNESPQRITREAANRERDSKVDAGPSDRFRPRYRTVRLSSLSWKLAWQGWRQHGRAAVAPGLYFFAQTLGVRHGVGPKASFERLHGKDGERRILGGMVFDVNDPARREVARPLADPHATYETAIQYKTHAVAREFEGVFRNTNETEIVMVHSVINAWFCCKTKSNVKTLAESRGRALPRCGTNRTDDQLESNIENSHRQRRAHQ